MLLLGIVVLKFKINMWLGNDVVLKRDVTDNPTVYDKSEWMYTNTACGDNKMAWCMTHEVISMYRKTKQERDRERKNRTITGGRVG